jgi:hypothetical protein
MLTSRAFRNGCIFRSDQWVTKAHPDAARVWLGQDGGDGGTTVPTRLSTAISTFVRTFTRPLTSRRQQPPPLQRHTLQNEIEELRAKMQDQEEELGAAREANRQLIGQLNRPAPSDGLDGRRGTMQDATRQD